ncbi:hypothetical protein [Nocardia nova]|uniref:hypothetical protein n=1 Tax=Nocardia nova TaxID=37330 RepID=UPI0027383EE5|nr:hypothetical protein [Nocardia nova]
MNPTITREGLLDYAAVQGWTTRAIQRFDVVVLFRRGRFILIGWLGDEALIAWHADAEQGGIIGKTSDREQVKTWIEADPVTVGGLSRHLTDPVQIVDFEHLRSFANFLIKGFAPGAKVDAQETGRMIRRFVEPQPELQS